MTYDIGVAVREDDRDAAADLLAEHYALGTLDKDTLEARLSDVLTAATTTQLSVATADLPALRPGPTPPSRTTRRRDERPDRTDSRHPARSHHVPGRHRGGRKYALAALLVVVLCLAVDDPTARILVAVLVATALTRKLHHHRHHHRRA
ncbi:DUF1707 SHOCT-like domain-containing protein [Embleya sp. NPDC055664]|uniref:DUF1707 SHOCT-like domain-containing protein n=1 Tax=Embleya sp. NPDC059237 TaxID=3346784 RepID=UPI0036A45B8D